MYMYMRNISKHHFSGGGVLLNSIMDLHCSATEGGADQNQMTVDVRGGAVKVFHFAEVINKCSLNGRIAEIRVFELRIVCIKNRVIIYGFQIHFCFCFASYIIILFCFGFTNI